MQISNAIVIGAGIGGLAAATALAQRGAAVTLIEQAPAISEVGAGLQVSPNGMAVLRALGVHDIRSIKARAVVLRAFDGPGRDVARLDLSRYAADLDYLFVHRADLVASLQDAARRANVTFEMGVAADSVQPGGVAQVQMADGSIRRAELVVGADGLHSVVRPVLNGPDAPVFSGQVAWRAIVPNTVQHPAEVMITMGSGRHLVSYPLRDGRFVNLVAVEERKEWAAEGWQHADDPAHLRAAFADFGGIAGQLIGSVEDVALWGLHQHPVAKCWHTQGVALLGDAAHPTLPFLAQGANLALEDAWVLAAALAAEQGLAAFQSARMARVQKVVAAAKGNAWKYHLAPGPMRWLAHTGLRMGSQLVPGRMVGAFDWIYRYDATKLDLVER